MTRRRSARALRPVSRYYPRGEPRVRREHAQRRRRQDHADAPSCARSAPSPQERGLPVHMDGARLWNASVATGVPLAEIAALRRHRDGRVLQGTRCAGRRGVGRNSRRRWRSRGRRASCSAARCDSRGFLPPAVLYALDHHIDRLADDHANARALADALTAPAARRSCRPIRTS